MAIPDDPFWGSNHYEHPPLTDEMLAFAEAHLGVKLPDEYVRLLRTQNGGYTQGFAFPMPQPTSWANNHIPLDELFGIVTDSSIRTAQNLLETEYMTREVALAALPGSALGGGPLVDHARLSSGSDPMRRLARCRK